MDSRPLTKPEQDALVKRLRADPEFIASIKEGIEAVKAGRIIPWSVLKKELGL